MIREAIVYFVIAIFIGVSQSAGIGGGPILNISLMIGLDYDAKSSMSVTYIFLMGGAFASMLVNFQKKNPKTGGPIMDYNLIMVTLPMAVSGSLCGTILNHFISEFIITLLFTILLTYLVYNSYSKYKAISQAVPDDRKVDLFEKRIPPPDNPKLQQILESEREVWPRDKMKVLAQIFLYTVVVLLCKGGPNYSSYVGFQSCGIGSWICVIAHLVISYLISKSVAMNQFQVDQEKEKLGFIFDNKADKMSENKMRIMMMYGFVAGTLGGMLGLGGAIILVPAWLNAGLDKSVATSSSGPLIFFSAMVAYFLGVLSGEYDSVLQQVFYFVLAFIGSYGVKEFVNYITVKYNLRAMIYILLLITMSSSLVVLLPFQMSNYFEDKEDFMEFGRLC